MITSYELSKYLKFWGGASPPLPCWFSDRLWEVVRTIKFREVQTTRVCCAHDLFMGGGVFFFAIGGYIYTLNMWYVIPPPPPSHIPLPLHTLQLGVRGGGAFIHWVFSLFFYPQRRGTRHNFSRGVVFFSSSSTPPLFRRFFYLLAPRETEGGCCLIQMDM